MSGGVQAKSDQMYDDTQVDMSNWNIAENMPKETWYPIAYASHGNFAQDQANKRTSNRDDDGDSCTLSITAVGGKIFQPCMTGYLKEQIKSHFEDNLFGIVTNLQKRGKGNSDALELIKHVCVVFKLDNYVMYEIQIMKNLLKIINGTLLQRQSLKNVRFPLLNQT
nr:DNA polymerase epsilon catalytic subunit [Tanacetum cinerariifolium]